MLLLLVVILLVQRPHQNQPEKRCLMSCIDVPAMVTVTVLCAGLMVPLHPAVRSCVFQILLKCTYPFCAACSQGAEGEDAVCLAGEGGCDPAGLWLEALGQAARGAGPWGCCSLGVALRAWHLAEMGA